MVKWVAVLFGMRAVVGDDGRPYFVLGAAGLIEETSGDKRGEWSNTLPVVTCVRPGPNLSFFWLLLWPS